MAKAPEKPNTFSRISAPEQLDGKTLAFLRRRSPERCVVFAAWDVLEPREGKYDEDAFEELRGRLMTVASLGAEPVLSLYRGEDPGWFSDRDGWVMEDDLRCYLRYVGKTVRSVGHLVSEYITFYEPNALAWRDGQSRPRLHNALTTLSYMAAANARAYRLIKDTRRIRDMGETSVGVVMRLFPRGELRRELLRGKARAADAGYQRAPLLAMARGAFHPPLRNVLRIRKDTWADFIGVTGTSDAAGRVRCCARAAELTGTEARIVEEQAASPAPAAAAERKK